MRFIGQIFKCGKFWAIKVPILDAVTQGRTKTEAYEMIADAIESLVDRKGFKIRIFRGEGEEFEIGASDRNPLAALLLRRERLKSGMSLAEVAERLGSKSPNSCARYEQGRSTPSIQKLTHLFSAVAQNGDFVLAESRIRTYQKATTSRRPPWDRARSQDQAAVPAPRRYGSSERRSLSGSHGQRPWV
jgi:transcriptional regulator with XRE-family HTH domain/predicted RNase H-like HicB family nuclease